MGSYSKLKFKKHPLFWSKNHLFSSNGMGLFMPDDKRNIIYDYADDHKEEHPAYVRKLSNMVDRLDLLGYSLDKARNEIKKCIHPEISLEEFIKILSLINLDETEDIDTSDSYKITEDSLRFENLGLGGYILRSDSAMALIEKYRYEEDYLENRPTLDPLLELRCLAEIAHHADGEVVWEYYDLVEGGWITDSDINIPDAFPSYLVLTEGKTDTEIIQNSINALHPNIKDFFFFADTENHPFGGTNDITKFVKGLIDIKYKGNLIVLLDNDLEGNNAFNKINSYNLPRNFSINVLPQLDTFKQIETVGTNGITKMDINGKAVAIECFLDSNLSDESPLIRWTNWDEKSGQYQGSYEKRIKNKLKTKFDDAHINEFVGYDTSKLALLTDFIIQKAKEINDRT